MWRSWVDRINTINKLPEETGLSKEVILRQEEQQARLADIWEKCLDTNLTEEEHSRVFLETFLPYVCDSYEELGTAFTFNAIPDEKGFISLLTKELISGIRKLPELKSKTESSQALMDSLRSKSHLFNVIRAIRVASYGPNIFASLLIQQRIPSIIVKLFRSFIDLSAAYYEQNSADENTKSIAETGDIVTDILKQFVHTPMVLHRMVVDDTLFMIVRFLSIQPAQTVTEEPAYMVWKYRTVNILKSFEMNGEIAQYLYTRRCIEMLIRVWSDCISRDQPLTLVDYQEILLGFDIVLYFLKESMRIHYYSMIEEVRIAKGYDVLCTVIKTGPVEEGILRLKMDIVNRIKELAFIGNTPSVPSVSEGLPYQHPDFVTPRPIGSTDKLVRNTQAFQCLLNVFLSRTTEDELPLHLRIATFNTIRSLIEAHPCNYFITERINALPQIIEGIEGYDREIQKGALDLLTFVLIDLNFVPLKELAVLSLYLQGSSSGTLVKLICNYLSELLKRSPKFFIVVQEAGLINVMSLMLSDVTEKLRELGESNVDQDPFLKHVLDHFDVVIQCLITMTSVPENVTIFRKIYRGNLFDLLRYKKTRMGALQLFEGLSTNAYDPKASSPPISSITLEGSTVAEVGNAFSRVLEATQHVPRDDLEFREEVLKTIRRIFKAHSSTKDIFRRVGGYVSIVSMIVALEGAFDEPERFMSSEGGDKKVVRSKIIAVLQMVFAVLGESMRNHQVNKGYFMKDVGYSSLENAITLTGALGKNGSPQHVFGIFFAFAVENESIFDLFVIPDEKNTNEKAVAIDLFKRIESKLKYPSVVVVNPEIMPTILNLQKSTSSTDPRLSRAALYAVLVLAQGGRRNQVKMNGSGLILELLERAFPVDQAENSDILASEKDILLEIIKRLMSMGVSFAELRYMFTRFSIENGIKLEDATNTGLLELVLQGASRSRWPNFIQFDMGSGASSIEIPALENFPGSNPGYTFMLWLHLERIDNISDVSLFNIYDGSQLLFSIYIDSSTNMLHVYSMQTKQESVFRSFKFNVGFWYHLSLVHYKSRLSSKSSTMVMYINGVKIDTITCPYIVQPMMGNTSLRGVIGTPGNDPKLDAAEDLRLVWDLGPTYLILDTLEEDRINLYFNLGARYKSLFQDSLRQFQTYEASTALYLTLRNMSKSPNGRRDSQQQMLANVMRGAQFQTLPESKILFAFFACNMLVDGKATGLTLTGLSDATTAVVAAEIDRTRMMLNSAIPKLSDAIYTPCSMGYLRGEPVIAFPFGLDESIWKIGGCAIVLKLIERSETVEALYKATGIIFEVIRYSWRNSEDMVRTHGYEVLGYLLKQKRDLITPELLELLLVFIGKNPASPEDSVINNSLAYRYIILNFEIWKKTSLKVQMAHLDQFILFFETSKLRQFNIRRLPKIHLVKNMLLAFRMNIYAKELIPQVVGSLKAVVLSNWNTESIRTIATFLASTVSNTPSTPANNQPRGPRIVTRSDSTHSINVTKRPEPDGLSGGTEMIIDSRKNGQSTKTVQMRNIVLEMLHDILCNENNIELVNKFSSTITNKWSLLFFAPGVNPYTVVLTTRILARICTSQGSVYVNKFRVSSEGFMVMRQLLPFYWNLTQLQETLLLMLLGIDICNYPIYETFDINNLRSYIKRNNYGRVVIPDILPIIIAFWEEGRKTLEKLSQTDYIITPVRTRSSSLDVGSSTENQAKDLKSASRVVISRSLDAFIKLFDDLYDTQPDFRENCNRQEVIDSIVHILFSAVCQTHGMSIEDELNSKDTVLTNFELEHMSISAASSPIDTPATERSFIGDDTMSVDSATHSPAASIMKRGGTSALMTKTSPHVTNRNAIFTTRLRSASWSQTHSSSSTKTVKESMVESLIDFIVDICVQSVVDPNCKTLGGLALVMTALPPSTHDQQLLFESYLMTHIAQNIKSTIQLDMDILFDNRILSNIARFAQVGADAVIQGRFKEGGAEQTYDLLATILEILHSDYLSRSSSTDQAVSLIYRSFNRMILVKISNLENDEVDKSKIIAFLDYCIHHQKIILSSKNSDVDFLRCFCYHLYRYLLSNDENVREPAASMWKLLVLQKPDHVTGLFRIKAKGFETEDLIEGFKQMPQMDSEMFFRWLDSCHVELNIIFNEHICKTWENTIIVEQKYSRDTLRNHVSRRINKLKKLQKREAYEREIMLDYTSKTLAWSQNIQNVETSRFTMALQDIDGHENFIRSEWSRISGDLFRERAIWGPETTPTNIKWRLDYTEGPNRMRKRLQAVSSSKPVTYLPKQMPRSSTDAAPSLTKTKSSMSSKSVADVDKELTTGPNYTGLEQNNSSTRLDESSNEDEDTKNDANEDNDEIVYEEDKNRKVMRLLDHGDMVFDVYNISRISGLDACEGLLLLCKNNIYLVDNFFQRSDGEVVEIWDVPKEERDQYLILLARAAGVETEPSVSASGNLHTCRKWGTADLRDVFKRRFLFRDVALEMFFNDGQNALITLNLTERDELYSKLVSRVSVHEDSGNTIFGGEMDTYITSGLSNTFRLSSIFGSSTLYDLAQRWERREITNFQYLMYLNAIAGRSYNDLTQYPVFPWILADYQSPELDLTDEKTFRDLSKPMGAQTAERRVEFADRYKQWGETNDPAPAFHYGTHYSSAMIVCSFLIRLEPFTQHYLKLQGGTFDHADRLFDSIGKAWESASEKNMGDVRELIPEFFYLPEFLTNVNKFNFGVKQGTGEAIDSVVLPPWAHDDPKMFIQKHREALESDYVSENLHHWIDLIFGYKQQGPQAIDALNVFHHISYEGAVDLDSITDIVEKTATIGIINNFGQTPRQLFKKPHPARSKMSSDPMVSGSYVFQEHVEKLMQSVIPLRDIKHQIQSINIYNDKLGVTSCQQLLMPSDGGCYIEWGYSDNSLRLYATDTGKLLNVFENMHVGFISAACFPDSQTFVTGGTDNLVCMWKIKNDKSLDFTLTECLRGHTDVVTTISASRSYSIFVTGSDDKTAIVWDMNRTKYIRSLTGHENGVQLISINDTTGDIITCSGHIIRVWSINGDLYLTKSACPSSESILSCMFYERKTTEWNSQDLIITGHRKGVVKFWIKQLETIQKTGQQKWSLNLVHQLRHHNRFNSALDDSDIMCMALSGSRKTLFTGNRHGQVYSFVLPDTTDSFHFQREEKYKDCMICKRAFSVLERKNHCRACGGVFCTPCISNLYLTCPDKTARFCKPCFNDLAIVCNKLN